MIPYVLALGIGRYKNEHSSDGTISCMSCGAVRCGSVVGTVASPGMLDRRSTGIGIGDGPFFKIPLRAVLPPRILTLLADSAHNGPPRRRDLVFGEGLG